MVSQVPSAREEKRKGFGLCSKFSLAKWSGMSCNHNLQPINFIVIGNGIFILKPIILLLNMEQMVERINWMADRSDKGLSQSGGIMVNYVYR